MPHFVRAMLALSLIGVVAIPLAAQDIRPISRGPERQGFFIGFGFGGGSAMIDCDVCSNKSTTGGTGWLTLGGTISPKLRLAADFNAWAKDSSGNQSTLGTGTFSALYYPSATGNFFLKAGVGYSITTIKDDAGGTDAQGSGFGGAFGVGYDFRVGRKISFTPQFTLFGGSTGDVKDGSTVVMQDSKFNAASLSIGIVFH